VNVRLNRPLGEHDPEQVSVDYTVVPGTAAASLDYVPAAGTLIS
jgi:hypothetical protein